MSKERQPRKQVRLIKVRAEDLQPGDAVQFGSGRRVYWRTVADTEKIRKTKRMKINYTEGFPQDADPNSIFTVQEVYER